MHFINAQITNFRGIEQLRLEFEPGFHMIKGMNGKGKTSILNALNTGLSGILSGIEGCSTEHFTRDEIGKVYGLSDDGSLTCDYSVPVEVILVASIEGVNIPVRWIMSRTSIHASKSSIQPKDTAALLRRLAKKPESDLPVLSFQGVGRACSQRFEKTENIFRKKYARTAGYLDALSDSTNLKFLYNWCSKMEKTAEYKTVMGAAADFAGRLNGREPYRFFLDKKSEEFMCQDRQGILPIGHRNAGFQSLIWMVLDIACRMALLNPHKKEELTKSKGIVLIDELDMHLDPKQQVNVIGALRSVFPNVQFIATTSSPAMIASAKDIRIIDVENGEPEYIDPEAPSKSEQ